jgi:hypothetical protein
MSRMTSAHGMDWEFDSMNRSHVRAVCAGCGWASEPLRPEVEGTWDAGRAAFTAHLHRPDR